MKRLLLMPLLMIATIGAAKPNLKSIRRSVMKIRVISQSPNYQSPWLSGRPYSHSGTGFYIGKGRILTNAHVLAHQRFVTVQKDGSAQHMPARVEFMGSDCDLALLHVDDPSFFQGIEPLEFGDVPKLLSPVVTVGYPRGGEQISFTKGVVSRFGVRRYVHSGYYNHLLIQVDSAINPGNSGGPVVQHGRTVGVAFQSHSAAENTGYIIPVPVIRRFLADCASGRYQGHSDEGIALQPQALDNPETRAFYGLKNQDEGVRVSYVANWSPVKDVLQQGDVLLGVDKHKVGVDGKVRLYNERVDVAVVFDLKLIGESIRYRVLRNGNYLDLEAKVKLPEPHYFNGLTYTKYPSYYTFGGMVFSSLDKNLLKSWGDKWYHESPLFMRYLHYYSHFEPRFANNVDFIVLVQVLSDAAHSGAEEFRYGLVKSVNGRAIRSITQLKSVLESPGTDKYVRIDFHENDVPLLLNHREVLKAAPKIRDRYAIKPSSWINPGS